MSCVCVCVCVCVLNAECLSVEVEGTISVLQGVKFCATEVFLAISPTRCHAWIDPSSPQV